MFVITLLARTGVNVQSDLLAILVYRTHLVHFVLVRNRVISKRQNIPLQYAVRENRTSNLYVEILQ